MIGFLAIGDCQSGGLPRSSEHLSKGMFAATQQVELPSPVQFEIFHLPCGKPTGGGGVKHKIKGRAREIDYYPDFIAAFRGTVSWALETVARLFLRVSPDVVQPVLPSAPALYGR